MSAGRRQRLLETATKFCSAFADQKPPDEIFALFSESEDVVALEHGLPELAPFLGREFKGQKGIRKYFETIASLLKYEKMRFNNFLVDPEAMQISVKGSARFTWTSTNQSWDEIFTYVLGFDDNFKVARYEIWADSGAAYLASKGQLNQ